MAYINNEVVKYLLIIAKRVEINNNAKVLNISNYKTYVLLKAYYIILKLLYKIETLN